MEDDSVQGVVFDLSGDSPAEKHMPHTAAPAMPPDTFGLIGDGEDAFSVSVRNAEPILKRLGEEKAGKKWVKGLQINLAAAAGIMVLFSLLLTSAMLPEMIPFTLPALVVFMMINSLESFGKYRLRLYSAAALAVALIAALILLRGYISSGWALIMNQFYDTAEASQAYIYNRFHVGETGDAHPYRSMHFALLWGSAAAGLIAAVPPLKARRTVGILIAAFTMIALAYYGIIPAGVCIAVMAAAAVFVLSRGHILSSLPVLLIVMLVFGAVMLIDPGENYGISRADENFRDRFALISSQLQNNEEEIDIDTLEQEEWEQQNNETGEDGTGFIAEHSWVVTALILIAILAGLGAAAWIFRQRLRRKQLANREGIDSEDPDKAITAMFPYAVRWLQPAGIEPAGKPFDALTPVIRADLSDQYADSYEEMYELWKEAAYSDHEMTEDDRGRMKTFLQDTIEMVRSRGNFRTNLINTIRYAL